MSIKQTKNIYFRNCLDIWAFGSCRFSFFYILKAIECNPVATKCPFILIINNKKQIQTRLSNKTKLWRHFHLYFVLNTTEAMCSFRTSGTTSLARTLFSVVSSRMDRRASHLRTHQSCRWYMFVNYFHNLAIYSHNILDSSSNIEELHVLTVWFTYVILPVHGFLGKYLIKLYFPLSTREVSYYILATMLC